MDIQNSTPFEIAHMGFFGYDNRPSLSVIVKGTFDFSGALIEKPRAVPIFYGDESYENKEIRSVKYEADIIPYKPLADIVLVGKACAPEDKAAGQFEASLRVGKIKKSIMIFGRRRWRPNIYFFGVYQPTDPEPVTEMDIIDENAFGGRDKENGKFCAENLIGKGFMGEKRKDVKLPNIEDPNKLITGWKDKPKPVGLGFYGRAHAPRMSYIGTYDEKWQKERLPKLPKDFNFRFYNGAHPDLQVEGYLKGNEDVELINLTSEGKECFRLTGMRIGCNVEKERGNEEIKMELDTLCLIPAERRYYQVWRGVCPVESIELAEVKKINVATTE